MFFLCHHMPMPCNFLHWFIVSNRSFLICCSYIDLYFFSQFATVTITATATCNSHIAVCFFWCYFILSRFRQKRTLDDNWCRWLFCCLFNSVTALKATLKAQPGNITCWTSCFFDPLNDFWGKGAMPTFMPYLQHQYPLLCVHVCVLRCTVAVFITSLSQLFLYKFCCVSRWSLPLLMGYTVFSAVCLLAG